jgi:hypothetical protein
MTFMSRLTCLEFLKSESVERQKAEVKRARGNALVSLQPVLIGLVIYIAVLVLLQVIVAFITDPTTKAIFDLIVMISILLVQLWGIYIMLSPLFQSLLHAKNERFDDVIFLHKIRTDLIQKLKLQFLEPERLETLATLKLKRKVEDGAFDFIGLEKVSLYGLFFTTVLPLSGLNNTVKEAFANIPSAQPLITSFNSYLPYAWAAFAVIYIVLLTLRGSARAVAAALIGPATKPC